MSDVSYRTGSYNRIPTESPHRLINLPTRRPNHKQPGSLLNKDRVILLVFKHFEVLLSENSN